MFFTAVSSSLTYVLFLVICYFCLFLSSFSSPISEELNQSISQNSTYNDKFFRDENDGNQEMIVGGRKTVSQKYPFMAIILHPENEEIEDLCVGTIISKRLVLTAAHCLDEKIKIFRAILGEDNKRNYPFETLSTNGQSFESSVTFIHPKYRKYHNDVGLIVAPKDIIFTDYVKPVILADESYHKRNFSTEDGQILGYSLAGLVPSQKEKLTYGFVTIISPRKCVLLENRKQVTDHQMCTLPTNGAGTCIGDSGSPLLIKDNNKLVQIGIDSYGEADCQVTNTEVYTRVSSYSSWINKKIIEYSS